MHNTIIRLAGAFALALAILPGAASADGWDIRTRVDEMDGSVRYGGLGPTTLPTKSLASPYKDLVAWPSYSCFPPNDSGHFSFWFSEELILDGGEWDWDSDTLDHWVRVRLGDGEVREIRMFQTGIASKGLVPFSEGTLLADVIAQGGELLVEVRLHDHGRAYFLFDLSGLPVAAAGTPCPLDAP